MNEQETRVIVLGSINMDLVVRCETLPKPGETVLAHDATEFAGGKGANQAVQAARLGAQVSIVGRVGDDVFADRLLQNLTEQNVSSGWVQRTDRTGSGLAIVSVDAKAENSIVVVPGANACLTPRDVETAYSAFEDSDIFLTQLEVPLNAVLSGMKYARECKLPIVLDPAPACSDAPDALFDVDILCPNLAEAGVLLGRRVNGISQAKLAAVALHNRGAKNVVITLGEHGALLYDGKRFWTFPAHNLKAVDTTAAGDAFTAALAVEWARGRMLNEAVAFANAAGACAVTQHGAQASLARRELIEQRLRA